MLQFTYKLKLTERVKAKCSRHPRYNPEKDGRAGIRGGCSTCFSLYDLHQARLALDAAQREFIRRAGPWARRREPRQRKATTATEEPPFTNLNLETAKGLLHAALFRLRANPKKGRSATLVVSPQARPLLGKLVAVCEQEGYPECCRARSKRAELNVKKSARLRCPDPAWRFW